MTTLTKKLKEINKELKLEVKQAALAIKAKELEKKKLASDRAKLKAKLRIEEKKKEAANNKIILSNFKKYAKLINDNELLIYYHSFGEAEGHIRQVAFPEARVLQVRDVHQNETVGYGATWTAQRDSRVVVANMGYADGFLRCHAGSGGGATWQGQELPLIGRVSMDLIAFDASEANAIGEGDWLALGYDLPSTAARSGLSQYELLTGLGARFERIWS